MKKFVALILALSMVFALCACGHEHTWAEATCTEPKTCTGCGETEGEPLGHKWKDATCTDPKTCTVCGATEGEALGHKWKDATCTEPKTCTVCGAKEGNALGHQAGSWQTVREASLISGGKEQKTCKVCGEVVDTRTTDKKKISYSGGKFNFTEDELIEYLKDSYNSKYSFYYTGSTTDPFGGSPYGISQSGNLEAVISVITNSGGQVKTIVVWGKGEQTMLNHAIFIYTLICQVGATEKTDKIFDDLSKYDSCTLNGITITFKNEGVSGGDTYISFTITG